MGPAELDSTAIDKAGGPAVTDAASPPQGDNPNNPRYYERAAGLSAKRVRRS